MSHPGPDRTFYLTGGLNQAKYTDLRILQEIYQSQLHVRQYGGLGCTADFITRIWSHCPPNAKRSLGAMMGWLIRDLRSRGYVTGLSGRYSVTKTGLRYMTRLRRKLHICKG